MGFFDKLKQWRLGGHHRKHISDKDFRDKGHSRNYYYDNRGSDNYQPKTSMQCSNCGNLNIDGARFCQSCGVSLIQATFAECIKCGSVVSKNAKFCNRCGQQT